MAKGTMETIFPELTKKDGNGAFTVTEIADKTGLCLGAVQNRIRAGVRAGVLEFAGRRDGKGIDGRHTHTPLYRPVTPKAR